MHRHLSKDAGDESGAEKRNATRSDSLPNLVERALTPERSESGIASELGEHITTDSGEVLVDEDATTYANGFVGFWIPKDLAGTVVVTKDGKRAESRFSSDSEGPTCLTTLQLL